MPVSFEFKGADGERASLSTVDEEMCVDFGLTVDLKRFSWIYDAIVWVGIGVLHKYSEFTVTDELLTRWRADATSDTFTEEQWLLIRKYLCGRYTFSAWR